MHPHPPLPAEDLADRLGVRTEDVLDWIHEGLPQRDGLIDPFAASNWLCLGRLHRCPVLARRWQSYLRWFEPHVHAADRPRRYRVQQNHQLFLPGAVQDLTWYVPRLVATSLQPQARLREGSPTWGRQPSESCESGPYWRAQWSGTVDGVVRMGAEWDVQVVPQPVEVFPERAELVGIVRTLVADFRYEYRHHRPHDDRTPIHTSLDGLSGSCLDCALELARRMRERGRAVRVCTGVIACSAISNPHFWLRVDTSIGWVVVDPSLPAIARMLKADWEGMVEAYVGGCDARRITIAEIDTPVPGIPGGASLGSRLGEVIATRDGRRANAWPCLDWVCGECSWTFN